MDARYAAAVQGAGLLSSTLDAREGVLRSDYFQDVQSEFDLSSRWKTIKYRE
jgi:hypothetical protein